MLTKDEVRHIAQLARISVSEEEVTKFQKDLSSILDWVAVLAEVPTEGVERTMQVTGKVTTPETMREDLVEVYADMPGLIEATPNSVADGMIQIPNIMKDKA